MTRDEALAVLGIPDSSQTSAAFRRLSVTCHPDGPTPDAERWTQITAARSILITPVKCAECKGTGRTIVRKTRMFCKACGGKGWSS